ncbi:hypothetical protein PIIN_01138 [Serendipita indica DSM 11827]|uniref:Uncharacterized protein n=1 Tax=Serendipita indica (strain DSM 11827) TaxID=1109443 RepID=G4T7K6_SERID|nr:hypothetical protein PIIN_01138 [Serendipita indica DSM 11827]
MSQAAIDVQKPHPISIVFMLHILLEAPFCIVALVSPESLPFLEMSNTSLLVLKLYAGLVLSSILAAYLVSGLPEFLPGKRAVALQLCLYHTVAATALWHSPRFIPITLGEDAERLGITLEKIWCVSHGFASAALGIWWHITIPYMIAMKGK